MDTKGRSVKLVGFNEKSDYERVGHIIESILHWSAPHRQSLRHGAQVRAGLTGVRGKITLTIGGTYRYHVTKTQIIILKEGACSPSKN